MSSFDEAVKGMPLAYILECWLSRAYRVPVFGKYKHLCQLSASSRPLRTERTVSVAGNDTLTCQFLDIVIGPVPRTDVLKADITRCRRARGDGRCSSQNGCCWLRPGRWRGQAILKSKGQ